MKQLLMKRINRVFLSLSVSLWSAVAMAASPFDTVTVTYEEAPRERIWDGRTEAVNQGTVSAQTSGRVAELPYDVNDFVEAI